MIGIFFALLFAALFYLLSFILNERRLALLVSGGGVIVLLLRVMELRSWPYPLLIFVLVVAIELFARTGQKR